MLALHLAFIGSQQDEPFSAFAAAAQEDGVKLAGHTASCREDGPIAAVP